MTNPGMFGRIAAVTGAAALVFTGLSGPAGAAERQVGSAAAPGLGATAVTCGNAAWPHENWDTGSGKTTRQAAVHTGPYGDCAITAYLPTGTQVTFDCYTINDYGNTWTWVRDPRGASIGWVYDEYLNPKGAMTLCPKY
ncbi:hypothetical protein ACVMYR_31095 [Micromonospora sp. PTRAS2]